MAKNRMINTRFWSDNYIYSLTPKEKLLFLYLCTNQYTNICGIYEIPLPQIGFDTGIKINELKKIINKFSKDDKIYCINGWICIKNFTKHQKASGNIKAGIEKGRAEVPKNIMATISQRLDTPPSDPPQTPLRGTPDRGMELESELEFESKYKLELEKESKKEIEPEVLEIFSIIRNTFGLPKLDKDEKKNITAARKLLKVKGVSLDLIRASCERALQDKFWGTRITSAVFLENNFMQIASLNKKQNDQSSKHLIL